MSTYILYVALMVHFGAYACVGTYYYNYDVHGNSHVHTQLCVTKNSDSLEIYFIDTFSAIHKISIPF